MTQHNHINQLITEHMDIWTSAIKRKSSSGRGSSKKSELYGIKKLRELILELAVRGKLVPQDPTDEPASVLLERIAQEKAQLVKEGKIKKPKKLPEITEDEKPFELPDGWECVRLGEVINISSGNGLIAKQMNIDGGIPVYGGNGVTGYHDQQNVTEPTLVIGRVGFYCGSIHITPDKAWITDNAFITKFSSANISLDFLAKLLKATNLKENENATAQPVISGRKIYPIVINIPPYNEQHRIVAKVDELMALCDQLEAQTESSLDAHQTLVTVLLDTLVNSQNAEELAENWTRISSHFDTLFTTEHSIDQLKQTILQLAVMGKLVEQNPNDEPASVLLERIAAEKADLIKQGKIKKQKPLPPITEDEKPFELPKGWEWVSLSSLIILMDAGWSPACPPESSPNNETWGVLKTTAVQNMEYREYENKVLDTAKDPKPQYEVKVGDILITRAGPKNRVGVSCLVQSTRPHLMISDKIIRFHLVEVEMSERFISLCLNAGATAQFLETVKSGMAESQMNISQDKLKIAPIPLAPLEEQHRIVAKVDELMALCDQLKARLSDAQTTQLNLADALVEQAL